MDITLEAKHRDKNSKANQLRKQGHIPCTIYSKALSDNSIQITESQMKSCLKSGAKKVKVNLGGKSYFASIEEVQKKPASNEILHVSFHAFEANEKIYLTVPVHIQGKSLGQLEGGLLQLQMQEVTLYGMAQDLPEEFILDVSKLELGHSIHVSDLASSGKYEIKESMDRVFVSCNYPKLEVIEPEVAPIVEMSEVENSENIAMTEDEHKKAA